jgi:hypothetical protein
MDKNFYIMYSIFCIGAIFFLYIIGALKNLSPVASGILVVAFIAVGIAIKIFLNKNSNFFD